MQLFKRRCIVLTDEHGKVYVVDGQVHREDGPAVECNNGNKAWFLNGKEVSEELCRNKAAAKKLIAGKSNNKSYWRRLMGD